MRGANVDSDHYLLKATIRERISKVKAIQQKKPNIEALRRESMAKKFSEYIERHLEIDRNQTIKNWSRCTETLRIAAEKILRAKRDNKDWFDEECRKATRKKNQAYLVMQNKKTRATREKYKELRRIEKQIHKRKKRTYNERDIQTVKETTRSARD